MQGIVLDKYVASLLILQRIHVNVIMDKILIILNFATYAML